MTPGNKDSASSAANLPPKGTRLCGCRDIPDPGAKGFVFGEGTRRGEIFIVHKNGKFFGYVNACPHQGTPLDTFPDNFLGVKARYLICSTHGARFEPESGRCIQGPCQGESLKSVPLTITKEDILIG